MDDFPGGEVSSASLLLLPTSYPIRIPIPRVFRPNTTVVQRPTSQAILNNNVMEQCVANLAQITRFLLPVPAKHFAPTPASTIAFDTAQELFWAGNDYGRVSGFLGPELQRYTSFKAGNGPVCQLLFHDRGVIALSSNSVHMSSRRGLPIWHIVYARTWGEAGGS